MWSRGRTWGRGSSYAVASAVVVWASVATGGAPSSRGLESRLRTVQMPPTRYEGRADLLDRLTLGAGGRALSSGDFDEDGVPDLVVSLETSAGSVLVLYRGNINAIHPNAVEAKKQRAAGLATDCPFLATASVYGTPAIASVMATGDFDADGHLDLLATSIGARALYLHRGDGRGAFARAKAIRLPGDLTALTTGEINRRDGLADVVAAVHGSLGVQLLVFEDPAGAFAAPPEVTDLGHAVSGLALGQIDGRAGSDLAVATRSELLIVHGRSCRRSAADTEQAEISRLEMPFSVAAIAIGDFGGQQPSRDEIAVLTGDGVVRLVAHSGGTIVSNKEVDGVWLEKQWAPLGLGNWWLSREIASVDLVRRENRTISLQRARVSGGPTDDLMVFGVDDRRIYLMESGGVEVAASFRSPSQVPAPTPLPIVSELESGYPKSLAAIDDAALWVPTYRQLSIDPARTASAIRGAIPMRLNGDALSDLVMAVEGRLEPQVMTTKAFEITVVNSTTDVADGTTSSISDLNADPGADGVISLREAITAANNTPGADEIRFDIPVDSDPGCDAESGVCTIQPGGYGLPTITQPVSVDGTTQPSFQSAPVIEIDGSLATTDATGIAINAGGSVVRGLVINRFAGNSDIVMWGAGGNIIEGNFLGVDASGTFNRGTTNSVHVYAISNNIIGGTTAAARNVISGNTNPAVALNAGASDNLVQGNFIGTDLTGTMALGNSGNDVVTLDSPDNTIGGTTAGSGNLIAGNLDPDFASVGLGYPASTGNLVQGNYVGTDVTGTMDLGGASIGVYVVDGSGNTIGGTSPAAANVVSGGDSAGVGIATGSGNFVVGNLIGTQTDGVTPLPNSSHGVLIYAGAADNVVGGRSEGAGNIIAHNGASGVDIRGDAGVGNTVAGNSIHDNLELGINTCSDFDVDTFVCNDATAVTPNDPDDPDTGANNLQNFPVLSAVAGGQAVDGSLDSNPNSDFTLDFFASPVCDPSGHGEGETFLGSDDVTTDADGEATFTTTLATVVQVGWQITATATAADGSTSEFSQCFEVADDLIFADGFETGNTSAWTTAP